MNYVCRWADAQTAAEHPLAVQSAPLASADGWRCTLTNMPADTILTPSWAEMADNPAPFQWQLTVNDRTWRLLDVPSSKGSRPDRGQPETPVSTHIDCFHVHEPIASAELVLLRHTSAPVERYLVSVSQRPLTIDAPPQPCVSASARVSQPLSQMEDEVEQRRHHTCSPTSVAMLLPNTERKRIVEACLDAATGLFGSWALAVRTAAQHGALASCEVHADWSDVSTLLKAGYPFAASIRFAEGHLTGAPLKQTGGHLVVVSGISPDHVEVHDPAAATAEEVKRTYSAEQFSRAWLTHRGATYMIVPR